jgi:hypothetical protein
MTSRRGLLKAGGGLLGGLVVPGGIASETDYIDDPNEDGGSDQSGSDGESDDPQNGGPTDEETTTEEPNRSRETLRDTTVFTDKRWPHEFSPGDVVEVDMSIEEGGPGTFAFNMPEEDVLEDFHVDVSEEFSHEIEHEGRYFLEVIPRGEVQVTVVLVSGGS